VAAQLGIQLPHDVAPIERTQSSNPSQQVAQLPDSAQMQQLPEPLAGSTTEKSQAA
jgi:hypothetical protein